VSTIKIFMLHLLIHRCAGFRFNRFDGITSEGVGVAQLDDGIADTFVCVDRRSFRQTESDTDQQHQNQGSTAV
jgi:hypothetical protein